MDTIVAKLQERGSAPLDELSWQMAVDVAAEIVGLTNSDSNANLARRVKAVLDPRSLASPDSSTGCCSTQECWSTSGASGSMTWRPPSPPAGISRATT
ncbi:hypothetical protein ACFSHP_12755 [Novosphingobium panipatense]